MEKERKLHADTKRDKETFESRLKLVEEAKEREVKKNKEKDIHMIKL